MYNNLMDSIGFIAKSDPEVAEAMNMELSRQRRNLELIASENIVSPEVMAAMGSVLTNKYAEGYPGKRYYGGCECVDIIENIAIERAKKLFGAQYANVQAHSGAQANTAVYFAVLEPGDTVLGMSLAHGGHLTHGSPVNLSGKYFNFVSYGLGDDGRIDYEKLEELALNIKSTSLCALGQTAPKPVLSTLSDISEMNTKHISAKNVAPHISAKRLQALLSMRKSARAAVLVPVNVPPTPSAAKSSIRMSSIRLSASSAVAVWILVSSALSARTKGG